MANRIDSIRRQWFKVFSTASRAEILTAIDSKRALIKDCNEAILGLQDALSGIKIEALSKK